MNRIKQHSAIWRTLKAHYLGANDCASILGYGFQTMDEVIKCKVRGFNIAPSQAQQERMNFGTAYEPIVRKACANRKDIHILETGMKFHNRLPFLTASPDGLYYTDNGPVLTEFKVLSQLSDGKIPYKYWIQMQIQMAVWGINQCLYCENMIDKHGDIVEYYEHMVHCDEQWFSSVEPIILSTWKTIEELRRQARSSRTSKRKHEDDAETEPYVLTPDMMVNYVRQDPVLDWLNLYGPLEERDKDSSSAFRTMVNRKNTEFVRLVQDHFKQKQIPYVDINTANIPEICLPSNISVMSKTASATQDAINAKVPIIFNACFILDNMSGRADMLVKNTHISDVLNLQSDDDPDGYSVVMIKYASLSLLKDGATLSSNDKQRVYKAQMWFINKLLHAAASPTGYLIGRSYEFRNVKINDAIGHVAKVKFNYADDNELHKCALDWLHRVRQPEMKDLSLSLSEELFPNMKNSSDAPWHTYKTKLAKDINDITLMYRCGPRVRESAIARGITQWQQLDLQHTQCFLTAQSTGSLAPQHFKLPIDPSERMRFYLDFESVNNMCEDFSAFPLTQCSGYIFFIGVLAEDTVTGQVKYFSYKADRLDNQSELIMLNNMFRDLRAHAQDQTVLPFYYWSNAEKYMLERAMGRVPENVRLTDLCKIFRDNKIILPGQFGYGLKEIGRLMKELNMINTVWEEDADIASGMDAMVEAIRTYTYRTDPKVIDKFFEQIKKYNYVDCKIMQEIVGGGEVPSPLNPLAHN